MRQGVQSLNLGFRSVEKLHTLKGDRQLNVDGVKHIGRETCECLVRLDWQC
jgi:hypothetical protein